jgi:NDP-sugar pyrophosphorylase family protein
MKALVLSAGYGERLRPLTNTVPKPLLEVGGRPLVDYALLMLKAAGITDVAINVHHLGHLIEKTLGDGRSRGLKILYSPEPILMGTGGPLLSLRDYLAGERFVILNSDTIIDLNLAALIQRHRTNGGIATMVLRANQGTDAYSHIEIDSTSRIRRMRLLKSRLPHEFNDYPSDLETVVATALKSYMYCGVMVCEPALLDQMPRTAPFGLVGDVLAPRLVDGATLFGDVHDGFFRTVDDIDAYMKVRDEFSLSVPLLAYLPNSPRIV